MRYGFFCALLLLFVACKDADKYRSPEWGDVFASSLFGEVQMAAVFPDSKTFPDCIPHTSWQEAIYLYKKKETRRILTYQLLCKGIFVCPTARSIPLPAILR